MKLCFLVSSKERKCRPRDGGRHYGLNQAGIRAAARRDDNPGRAARACDRTQDEAMFVKKKTQG